MEIEPNKLIGFINKTFSIKQNATWKAEDFAAMVALGSAYKTYIETVNNDKMPNADTLHDRIKKDAEITSLLENFLNITGKQMKKLRGKKVIVAIDITCDPFFGKETGMWVHGYRSAPGSRGCYKFLALHVIVDNKRYFVYAIPMDIISDQTEEIEDALDYIEGFYLKIKAVLIDRGFANSSKTLCMLNKRKVKYLGLYPKYPNIKKIIKNMKRSFMNRKFKVRGVDTRLVIGKEVRITWTFVTNMEFADFVKYKKLYKKRWNIETGFRVQDEAQIKTKSTNIRVRYFFFLTALVLYNCWKSLNVKISFKKFLINLQRGVENACETKPT